MTKVVAIDGSPKMERGNTAKILAPFLEGMEKAGAAVELFYAKRLNVKPCDGEFHCWNRKLGECFIDDNMQSLLSQVARSGYPRVSDTCLCAVAWRNAEPNQQNRPSYESHPQTTRRSHACQIPR